jgi:hypothetical protein
MGNPSGKKFANDRILRTSVAWLRFISFVPCKLSRATCSKERSGSIPITFCSHASVAHLFWSLAATFLSVVSVLRLALLPLASMKDAYQTELPLRW